MNTDAQSFAGHCVVPGTARGRMLLLEEPLSFWGGVAAESGQIIQGDHAQCGARLEGRVMIMARAKGSSSSSSVLAELIRNGHGPAAIVMREADLIVALGCIVASELYGIDVPVVTLDEVEWNAFVALPAQCLVEVCASAAGSHVRVCNA